MSSIEKTAYPRFPKRKKITPIELNRSYSLQPDEMEKAIKHNDLITNCIMLQNVIDMTDVCHALIQEGHTITEQNLSHMSPYMTEHLKRFGEYVLGLNRRPTNRNITREKFLFKEQSEPLEYAA